MLRCSCETTGRYPGVSPCSAGHFPATDIKMADSSVGGQDSFEYVERLKNEIRECKEKSSLFRDEIDKLEKEKQQLEILTEKYQSKQDKFQSRILANKEALTLTEQEYTERSRLLQDEYLELSEKAKEIKEEIDHCEMTTNQLKTICLSGMERKMSFKGELANCSSGLSVKHQIRYPVNGGSALITFKEESVAAQVISDRHHTINIEGCRIDVRAEPVELLVLNTFCMDMSLSPQKILVYDLPRNLSEGTILDKLELHFARPRNGGGEVDRVEFLSDCRSAIITFVDDSVASGLLKKKSFLISFGEFSHEVFVAPSLDGSLQNYKMKKLMCNRTVLLTGIPDITDKDNLRDLLELHFLKVSNDGVQVLMYCPQGESTVAIFDDQDPPMEE